MNCEHHSDFFNSEYVFLSTDLFTKMICEKLMSNFNEPIKSMIFVVLASTKKHWLTDI